MGFTSMFLRSLLQLGSSVVLIGTVTPFALPPLVPIMLLFYFLYLYLCVPLADTLTAVTEQHRAACLLSCTCNEARPAHHTA